jgi:hypothetical protein
MMRRAVVVILLCALSGAALIFGRRANLDHEREKRAKAAWYGGRSAGDPDFPKLKGFALRKANEVTELNYKGSQKSYNGDKKGAIELFSEAISVSSSDPIDYYGLQWSYSNRAGAKQKLGDWQGAAKDESEARRLINLKWPATSQN